MKRLSVCAVNNSRLRHRYDKKKLACAQAQSTLIAGRLMVPRPTSHQPSIIVAALRNLGLPGHRHQGSCAQSRLGLSILPFALHPPAPLLLPSSSLWTRQSTSPQRSAFSCPATHRPVINVIRLRCQLYHRHAPRSKRCDGQFAQLDTVWRELKEASPRTVYGYTAACQVPRTRSRRICGTPRAHLPPTA
jgi:hypothetical protein